MERTEFEQKLKPILLWMGTIVAAVMAIAYIFVVFVLIEGFKAETLLNTTLFSIITAAIGFCIMQMLKIQGQSFAKNIDENKKILQEYSRRKSPNGNQRKFHSMKYYWFKSVISDASIKCITLAGTSIGMVYIMIEGSGDYNLLLLAAVNLLMFAGFGLISLVKAYDFYNEEYIPYMLYEIEKAEHPELFKRNSSKHKAFRNKKSQVTLDLIKQLMSENSHEIQSESQGESKSDYVYDK